MSTKIDPKKQIGRLALREEGGFWVAYYAHPNTMELATVLGTIRMGAIKDNPDRMEAFKIVMRDIVSDLIEEVTGVRPIWGDSKTAPERERGVRP